MQRTFSTPVNMYEAEERMRRCQIERRIVGVLEKEFKALHKETHDITVLAPWSRMRNRGCELEREMEVLKQWIRDRGFTWVKA
jgi:hypothetical protein